MGQAPFDDELHRLGTLLNHMRTGCLAIVVCDEVGERRDLTRRLGMLLKRRVFEFGLNSSVLDPVALMRKAGVQAGDVVNFQDVEEAGDAALGRLEHGREVVWDLGASLVMWTSARGRRRLLESAPNFYSRRVLLLELGGPAAERMTMLRALAIPRAVKGKGTQLQKDVDAAFTWLLRRSRESRVRIVDSVAPKSVLVMSVDPITALTFALELEARTSGENLPLQWAVGIHTGPAVMSRGTLVGAEVLRADAIAALARGGQTLVSTSTRDEIGENLPEVGFFDLGAVGLVGRLYEVLAPGRLPQGLSRSRHRVPHQAPPRRTFVGRSGELERLADDLAAGASVMLLGSSGVGKTALALEAARGALLADRFTGGMAWVSLARDRSAEAIAGTLAEQLVPDRSPSRMFGSDLASEAVGVLVTASSSRGFDSDLARSIDESFTSPMSVEDAAFPATTPAWPTTRRLERRVKRWLTTLPCLLVFDGVDCVMDDSRALDCIASFVESSTAIVTSSRPLPPGSLASTLGKIELLTPMARQEAESLLRVAARGPAGPSTDSARTSVLTAAAGIPLLLLLLAPLLQDTAGEDLSSRLQTVTEGHRDEIVALSIDALGEGPRTALARATVFPEDCTVEAFQSVTACGPGELAELVARHFLALDSDDSESSSRAPSRTSREMQAPPAPGSRCRLVHDDLRKAASVCLEADPDSSGTLLTRFVRTYQCLLEEAAKGRDTERISREWRNGAAAAETAATLGDWPAVLSIAEILGDALSHSGHLDEGIAVQSRACQAAKALALPAAEGEALLRLARLHLDRGRDDSDRARECLDQALALFTGSGNLSGQGRTLLLLGDLHGSRSEWEDAERSYRRAHDIFSLVDDRTRLQLVLVRLGDVLWSRAQTREAEATYRQVTRTQEPWPALVVALARLEHIKKSTRAPWLGGTVADDRVGPPRA